MANLIRPLIQNLEQNLRDIRNPVHQERAKGALREKLEMVKTAALVTAFACVLIFVFVPKILAALVLIPTFWLCYEVATLAGNLREIVNEINQQWFAQLNPRRVIDQLGAGTVLPRLALNLILHRINQADLN